MRFPFARRPAPAPVVEPQKLAVPKDRFTHSALGTNSIDEAAHFTKMMAKAFPRSVADLKPPEGLAMDADVTAAMDANIQQTKSFIGQNQGFLPPHVLEWYAQYGFIGWQICAVLAQHWLINKACSMPGKDAVRHGFERSVNDGIEVSTEVFDKLREADKHFKLKNNLIEHYKFARVFGLRHTLFLVDGIDYEAPFNPDGIKPGSYRGMTQIDPYWLAPLFDFKDASEPWGQNFYNPTWWMINGQKYHRSHFVISRNGNDLADLLKPSYFYGGIPTTQLIYDRVYSSDRTANEAPLLAMTKRLITLTTDTTKAMNNLEAFTTKLTQWLAFLNNFGCKVVGADEKVEQIDTSLAGLMETIVTQYELVAAIAEVPATKLMGTSPKGGIGDAGGYELETYREFLESIQEHELSPIVERHTVCVQRSLGIAKEINFEVQWNATSALTAKEQSEINVNKSTSDANYINAGVLLGEDVRKRLIGDRDSGYNGIEEQVDLPQPGDLEGEPEGGGDDEATNY